MDLLTIVVIVVLVCLLVYALNRTQIAQPYSTVVYGVAALIILILLIGYLTGSPVLRLR